MYLIVFIKPEAATRHSSWTLYGDTSFIDGKAEGSWT